MSLYSKKPHETTGNKISKDVSQVEKKRKRPTKKEVAEEEPVETVGPEIAVETPNEDPAPEPTVPEPVQDNDVGDQEQETELDSETSVSEEPEPAPEPVETQEPVKKRRVPARTTSKPKPVAKADAIDPDAPPKWFMDYVKKSRKMENDNAAKKKPQKVVSAEAQEYAQKQWQKPEVRQTVNNQVDSHFTKMYKQIFGR